ncbi:astacin-like metalloprotease toxin 1 [Vespula maculifrons]|uniref:Metalloendopeptidase n=1 Tax=Vespula maculifrons TaxID=7453 RepID=A0ABD2AS51_VESMC|nr:astacin-like metalloprotease toxin 1 [Vespula vulgaris]
MWNFFSSFIFVPVIFSIICLPNNVKLLPNHDRRNTIRRSLKSNMTQTSISYKLDTWSKYDNPEEGMHHEGDIQILNTRKTITSFKKLLWPNGIVYYTIDEAIENSPQQFSVLQKAMMILMEKTCIQFQRIYPNENGQYSVESWVNIVGNKSGCYSDLGRNLFGGPSVLNLNVNLCFDIIGHALHEMLHTLGAYHEHMRPDRDQHIYILWENIREGTKFNFKLLNTNTVTDYGLPYDYDSIMHYSMTAFSKSKSLATIIPKINGMEIGQRDRLSYYDVKKLLITYKCSAIYYYKNERLYKGEYDRTEVESSNQMNNISEIHEITNITNSVTEVGLIINPATYHA